MEFWVLDLHTSYSGDLLCDHVERYFSVEQNLLNSSNKMQKSKSLFPTIIFLYGEELLLN
jgi:hypothetical protein